MTLAQGCCTGPPAYVVWQAGTTPVVLVAKFAAGVGVVDTGGKFATGVIDTGGA